MNKTITHKYTFSQEEIEKLRDVEAGMVISNAQLNGLMIYKNVILEGVYKRLGIMGEAKKGFKKSIQFNLRENQIIHTETPEKEEDAKK